MDCLRLIGHGSLVEQSAESWDHADSQEVLICISTGKTLNDDRRMKMSTDQLYLKTVAEIALLLRQESVRQMLLEAC